MFENGVEDEEQLIRLITMGQSGPRRPKAPRQDELESWAGVMNRDENGQPSGTLVMKRPPIARP